MDMIIEWTLSISKTYSNTNHILHIPEIYKIKLNKKIKFVIACNNLQDVMNNQEVIDFINNNKNKRCNLSKNQQNML